MRTDKIKKELQTMKLHMDSISAWVHQTTDMIYDIEEQIIQMEESETDQNLIEFYRKYTGINHEKYLKVGG